MFEVITFFSHWELIDVLYNCGILLFQKTFFLKNEIKKKIKVQSCFTNKRLVKINFRKFANNFPSSVMTDKKPVLNFFRVFVSIVWITIATCSVSILSNLQTDFVYSQINISNNFCYFKISKRFYISVRISLQID